MTAENLEGKMGQHTPGPWRLTWQPPTEWSGHHPGEVVDASGNAVVFAALTLTSRTVPEAVANTLLAAAAPDLLEAAQMLVEAATDAFNLDGKDDDWIYDEMGSQMSGAFFAARDAIAKAANTPLTRNVK